MERKKRGKVYLIGAGPGDPLLITIKGFEKIKEADVIVYDHLANDKLLKYVKKDAELIYAGKIASRHALKQEEINHLLYRKASEDKIVARLKGGDPFVFGRGGEEAEYLYEKGIDFEIIPGVTSAIAVPAYAGIPLTHREYASAAALITGHEDPSKKESDIDWAKISTGIGTLVFLMGMGNLGSISRKLIENGRSQETPVAVIEKGSLPGQKVVVGTLKDIESKVRESNLVPPAVIIVGDVVKLRVKLNWFEKKPLFGKRIVVTRARVQASEFSAILEENGAEVIEFPTIEIRPPRKYKSLDNAFENLKSFQWIIFTSVNAVNSFNDRMIFKKIDIRSLHGIRIAAIGSQTAERLKMMGVIPDIIPSEYRAEAIIEIFKDFDIEGSHILIPRAKVARDILPVKLRKMGAKVSVVEAYETVISEKDISELCNLFEEKMIDMVTFTSSSTVNNFFSRFEEDNLKKLFTNVKFACIGPVTGKTLMEYGFKTDVMPPRYTIKDMAEAIIEFYIKKKK